MKNKIILFVGAITAIGLAIITLASNTPERSAGTGIKRTDLQRHDLVIPGREVLQVLVEFEAGAAFGKHKHPGEEIIYVTEGELEYEVEDKLPVTLKAGEVLFIPSGTIHAATNRSNTNSSELATYILEKGQPPIVIIK